MDKTKLKYRIRVKCECGADIACKTRVVGKVKKCPSCKLPFRVPPPEAPPDGSLWVVHQRLDEYEYREHATALLDYSSAIQSDKELHWHIIRTLEVIAEIQEQFRYETPLVIRQTLEPSGLRRVASGSSFGGNQTPHRRYT